MRLESSHAPFTGFATLGTAIIAMTALLFPSSVRHVLRPGSWPQVMLLAVLPLLGAAVVAWLARLGFLLGRAAHTVGRLPWVDPLPPRLTSGMARTGAGPVRCISSQLPIAFCTGTARPRIIVSEGLAEQLGDQELEAVLLHERQHIRDREPVVRAACEAAAEVLVFLPLARWWSQRRIEAAELRADRAALCRVGARPVAAALYRLGSAIPAAASFAAGSELRVPQLLGDPLPPQRPAAWTIATSLLGFPFAVAVVGCTVLCIAQLFCD